MKKVLFLLALCFATAANAQSFRFGPTASVGYELGLTKIFKDALNCKHRTLTLGVAYTF